MTTVLRSRFNGPPASAHGGVAVGMFASLLDERAATVRLLAPPPLDTELDAVESDGGLAVTGPDGPVALVRPLPADFGTDPLPWLPLEAVDRARRDWLAKTAPTHVFPSCFGCGHERPSGDGLFLYAGGAGVDELVVAEWTPDASLADADGVVFAWAVFAAMDCPSGAATYQRVPDTTRVLGEFSGRVDELPRVGVTYQVVGRPAESSGRRLRGDVAVVAADGRNLAVGQATWVVLGS